MMERIAQPDLVVTNFQMPDMKDVELLKRIPSSDISSLRQEAHFVILTGFLYKKKLSWQLHDVDGTLSKPLTAANAEKILIGLFTTEPARDVRDTCCYRDQTTDDDDPLDPALRGAHGNKEKELPRDLVTRVSSPHAISITPTEACYLPQGAVIARTLMHWLQNSQSCPEASIACGAIFRCNSSANSTSDARRSRRTYGPDIYPRCRSGIGASRVDQSHPAPHRAPPTPMALNPDRVRQPAVRTLRGRRPA